MSAPTTPRSRTEPGAPDPDVLLTAIGARLGEARRERGLTLAVVAARSGLSPAYVSQLESGAANPTLRALTQVAQAVGVDPARLFGPSSAASGGGSGDFAPRPAVAARAHAVAGFPGVWDRTAPRSSRLEARIVHGDAADHAVPTTHDGEEYVLVLHGSCRLHVGDASYLLGPGDGCHFPAGRAHHLADVSPDVTISIVMSRS